MFWLVPSGNDLLMLIGNTPSSSSKSAISIGDIDASVASSRIGAPIDTCRALAPTTLAFSKRVSLGGPIAMVSCSLELTASLFATLVLILRGSFVVLCLSRSYYVVDLQNHPSCFSSRLYNLHLHAERLKNPLLLEICSLTIDEVYALPK